MVYTWTLQVLAWWHRKPEDREAPKPKVDCGWWEALKPPRQQLSSDAAMLAWNPDREPFETWTAGLAEMRRQRNTELKKYGAYPFEPQNPLAFEWLALSVCCGLSDGEIAKKYRTHQVPPEAVKKARRRLAKRLHILP